MQARLVYPIVLFVGSFLLFAETAWSQDAKKEHSSLNTEQLKKILDALNYEYQFKNGMFVIKLSKPGENTVKYDVAVQTFDRGQALVVSANLVTLGVPVTNAKQASKLLLDVNDWNVATALSRGMRRQITLKGKEICYPRIEADLDCSMGVTQQDVNRLIQRFPAMVKEFELFMR
jgi:hypothetical protein